MDIVFKALADKNRRRILELLKQSDLTVHEIGAHFPITGASLSHHLDILKRARLVVTQREGQCIRYSLNMSVFEDAIKSVINLFQK